MSRAEVHWLEVEEVGRRPVLVLTASELLPSLGRVVVVGLSTTRRGVDSEVELDVADGIPKACVANLLDLRVVPQALLVEHVTTLGPERMHQVCMALEFVTGCR